MNLVCPLCNGLYDIDFKCVRCNSPMEEKGPLVNIMDDYSPYLLDDISHRVDGVKEERCIHTYQCLNCGYEENYPIERKEL